MGGSQGCDWGWLGQVLYNLAAHTKALEMLCKLCHGHKAVLLGRVVPVLLHSPDTSGVRMLVMLQLLA